MELFLGDGHEISQVVDESNQQSFIKGYCRYNFNNNLISRMNLATVNQYIE